MVFQCLAHTLGWPPERWRVLDIAHQRRNLAEYEGYLEVDQKMIIEMAHVVRALIEQVELLVNASKAR